MSASQGQPIRNKRHEVRRQLIDVLTGPEVKMLAIASMRERLSRVDHDLSEVVIRGCVKACLGAALGCLEAAKFHSRWPFKCKSIHGSTSKGRPWRCALHRGHVGHHIDTNRNHAWPQREPSLALILDAVAAGNERVAAIASVTGLEPTAVSSYLSHLAKDGRVVRASRGVWSTPVKEAT